MKADKTDNYALKWFVYGWIAATIIAYIILC